MNIAMLGKKTPDTKAKGVEPDEDEVVETTKAETPKDKVTELQKVLGEGNEALRAAGTLLGAATAKVKENSYRTIDERGKQLLKELSAAAESFLEAYAASDLTKGETEAKEEGTKETKKR